MYFSITLKISFLKMPSLLSPHPPKVKIVWVFVQIQGVMDNQYIQLDYVQGHLHAICIYVEFSLNGKIFLQLILAKRLRNYGNMFLKYNKKNENGSRTKTVSFDLTVKIKCTGIQNHAFSCNSIFLLIEAGSQ